MLRRALFLPGLIMVGLGFSSHARGQAEDLSVCSAFSKNGALVTSTIRGGSYKGPPSDLETRIFAPGAPALVIHTEIGFAHSCAEAFSDDGRWIATLVIGRTLTVIVFDRNTGKVHKQFSSEWGKFNDRSAEGSGSVAADDFLGGFLPDGSLALWRHVPQPVATPSNYRKYSFDQHLQRWSVEGELLSNINLGPTGAIFNGFGMRSIPADGYKAILVPDACFDSPQCNRYRIENLSGADVAQEGSLTLPGAVASEPVELLSSKRILVVSGEQSTAQKASIINWSGHLESQVDLPFAFPTIWLLMPDWYWAQQPVLSPDGEVAAICRTLVAWVLVDTDRDWGTEIVLLRTQPLGVSATIRTGKGGASGISVDHRNGMIRVAGYWGRRWHDIQRRENKSGKWLEVETLAADAR